VIVYAVVLITAALVFYSVGVWSERLQRVLRWWHVGFFAAGLSCDLAGTVAMSRITGFQSGGATLIAVMETSGMVALILMGIHLAWAVAVLLRGSARAKHTFHRFSLVVWGIWLIPYLTGAIGANS
jgi:uncharacterized repeat protein (TIGR03987 family)